MDLKIHHREDSLKIIKDKEFISIWAELAQESDGFTLIQEQDLVISWYKAYKNEYDPIILVAYKDENIVGILPLAISIDGGGISHAGHEQAEYNGWICKKKHEEDFLVESLILLKKEFDLTKWDWGWMPPHSTTNWLDSERLKDNGIYVNASTCDSPVYDLSDSTRIAKIKKSKSTKSKINRLKRSGDLRLERITDPVIAKKIFIDLKKIANFRNLAVYNNMPFEGENSEKEKWHLNHLDGSDSVHFTVLWQGDKLLACNFGFCSEDTVIIGLFTYNPVQGAHSPGNVFLIELIDFITEEGYRYLDLSPGGDPYKERFSNSHNILTKPVFCFNKVCKFKNDTITYLKNRVKQKYSYRDVINFKSKFVTKLSVIVKTPKNYLKNEYELFKFISNVNSNNMIDINVQKYEDLLLYKDHIGYRKRSEVIFSSLKNFERGDILYTLVSQNELLMFAWVSTSGKKHWNGKINELTSSLGNKVLIYDTFFSKNSFDKERLMNLLHKISSDHIDSSTENYLVKPQLVSRDLVLRSGFSSTVLD